MTNFKFWEDLLRSDKSKFYHNSLIAQRFLNFSFYFKQNARQHIEPQIFIYRLYHICRRGLVHGLLYTYSQLTSYAMLTIHRKCNQNSFCVDFMSIHMHT